MSRSETFSTAWSFYGVCGASPDPIRGQRWAVTLFRLLLSVLHLYYMAAASVAAAAFGATDIAVVLNLQHIRTLLLLRTMPGFIWETSAICRVYMLLPLQGSAVE